MSARQGKTLVLAGHGSQTPTSVLTTHRAAIELAQQGAFETVVIGFIRCKPRLAELIPTLGGSPAVVVPMTVCEGLVTSSLIPGAIGDAENITMAKPVGDHPTLVKAWAKRIQSVITDNDLPPEDTTVLIIGHGTPKAPASCDATKAIAAQMPGLGVTAHMQPVFLEEAPMLTDWPTVAKTKYVIAAPFFLAGGLHGGYDIPDAFGQDSSNATVAVLDQDAGQLGPYDQDGQSVYLVSALGLEPELAACILERADEALSA